MSEAELTATREILPGLWLQTYHAPDLAAAARAGQFVDASTPDLAGRTMRRPLAIAGADRATGVLAVHVAAGGPGAEWPALARPGDRVPLHGPLGRPFEVDARSRHLLLIAGPGGVPALRCLVDEALAAGRQVTLLLGARGLAGVYPSSLLPDEVEYVVATADGSMGYLGTVTDLLPGYEAWADQAFAAGPWPLLGELARLAAGRDARLGVARLGRKAGRTPRPEAAPGSPQARRRAWLQVAVAQGIGCATATCLACAVPGRDGPLRSCREGPTFATGELAWETGV